MGPMDIKDDIYTVMTNSRELSNYCQESVNLLQSKKISNSLNNFHLKNAIEFITAYLSNDNRSLTNLSECYLDSELEVKNIPIYNKVIDYIENYLINITCLKN